MGNLHSVSQAFQRLKKPLLTVKSPNDLDKCTALILPGVGAFDPAMKNLRMTGLIPFLKDWSANDRPLLGICLGLQLLFDSSDEGMESGLGLLNGHVQRLPPDQNERIPHMGWSMLKQEKECPLLDVNDSTNWMYFVHSFAAKPSNPEVIAATTKFGNSSVTAMVWKGRLGACQFHPEKSSIAGQNLLLRWLQWLKDGAKSFQ